MNTDTLYFVTGLPRSGTSVITNILRQNPEIYGEVNSALSPIMNAMHSNWDNISNRTGISTKLNVLRGLIDGYYSQVEQSIVFDRNINWVFNIPLLESVLKKQIKIIVCVRNPAEILTSFERSRKENPLNYYSADTSLRDNSSIASRAYHYAGPEGVMGVSHRNIKDAVTMGYLDRMLFIDYSRYCASPKSQTKRIYDFCNLPEFKHDFENITGENMSPTRKKLEKVTVNCVEYIGLDLYDQYNREIFWNAWM